MELPPADSDAVPLRQGHDGTASLHMLPGACRDRFVGSSPFTGAELLLTGGPCGARWPSGARGVAGALGTTGGCSAEYSRFRAAG